MKISLNKIIAIAVAVAMVIGTITVHKGGNVLGDTDYSQLTYSTITMTGDDTKTLDYCIVSNNLDGFGGAGQLWYGDGGITFQIAFSGAITPDKYDVTLNGTTPNDSVMKMKGTGIVQFNPNNLTDNAYSDIIITTGTQTLNIVIKKGTPAESATSESGTSESGTSETVTSETITGNWMSVTGWKWAHRQSNGTFIYEDGAEYNGVTGITALTAGNGADLEIKNEETTDLNKVGVNVINAGPAGQWALQVHVNVVGLDNTKVYSIKLLQGDNVVYTTNPISSATFYRTTLDLGGKLATGESVLSIDVEELEAPTGTIEVQDITITPDTAQIEAANEIYAHWTNPEGTAKAYAYIGSVETDNGAMASNGWNFNIQAVQPMTAIDKVNRTVGNATAFEPGSTQKVIVEAYNVFNQKIGYGEVNITMPSSSETTTAPVVTTAPVETTTAPVDPVDANPVNVTGLVATPGFASINVSWVNDENALENQVYDIYLDNESTPRVKGIVSSQSSAVVPNVSAGDHTVKIVARYKTISTEPVISDTVTVEQSTDDSAITASAEDLKVEGFQIKTNGSDSDVAIRTVCKAPSIGETITASDSKQYTVKNYGVIYTLDTNTSGINSRNALNEYYTILSGSKSDNIYTGKYTYGGQNRTAGYEATPIGTYAGWNVLDTQHTYYVRTMTEVNTIMANTLHVRAFVIVEDDEVDKFIYSDDTAITSVAEVADYLYKNSKTKNFNAHKYLFNSILHSTELKDNSNKYYRTQAIDYGWNDNLYIPQEAWSFEN